MTHQILPQQSEWHVCQLPTLSTAKAAFVVPGVLEQVQSRANELLDADSARYIASYVQRSSSHKFMSTVMTSGTHSDKVSALTLVVQESPVHTRKYFESLLNLAGKRSRDQALMALAALKDMLAQGTMLPNRKLRMFNKQPALLSAFQAVEPSWMSADPLPEGVQDQHLVYWAYEDWLKRSYFEILKILESWCNDEVEFARMRAVTFVFELLKEKPEQEENLLRLLVNKLGDTSKKIASRASHLLLQLQELHPSMKAIIVGSIESETLLRPGQSSHAKYYAIITLNQTVLQTSDPDLANKMLDIYFGLFNAFLNRSKKAHDEAVKKAEPIQEKEGSKKRKRRTIQPENDVDKTEQELEDKIIAQILTGINRSYPYSKTDSNAFEKHLETMFKITHSANFNTSVQALMLIQQISATQDVSIDRFMRTLYESLLDARLLRSSKQTMYLNLLYRSLKADSSVRRVKAFVKRMLQVLTLHEPPFVTAILYLVHELQSIFPGVRTMLDTGEALEDDEEEVFHDAPESDDEAMGKISKPMATKSLAENHLIYDGRKRDPEHSNADRTCLWEVTPWLHHYHPSVTIFAEGLMAPSKALPKPDPTSHTLVHFLDRFVYRNAKQKNTDGVRGSSIMQPALGSTQTTDNLITKTRQGDASRMGRTEQPLNSEAFWMRKADEIAPDEVFFHRYFGEIGPRKQAWAEKKNKKKSGDDDESVDVDDEFDDELGASEGEVWKALVGSNAELQHDMSDGEDDDEIDFGEGSLLSDGDDIMGLEDGSDIDSGFGDEDDAGVELNLESDEEDLVDSDDEQANNRADAQEGIGEVEAEAAAPEKKKKKRKLNRLPTFADAADYAKLVDQDGDADET